MSDGENTKKQGNQTQWAIRLLDLPWIEIIIEILKLARKVIQGMASEGVYEVLSYESTLEIHDRKGEKAAFTKQTSSISNGISARGF